MICINNRKYSKSSRYLGKDNSVYTIYPKHTPNYISDDVYAFRLVESTTGKVLPIEKIKYLKEVRE